MAFVRVAEMTVYLHLRIRSWNYGAWILMKKNKLIQKRLDIYIFSVLLVLMFYAYLPLVYSGEGIEEGVYVKPKESFEICNGKMTYLEYCVPCHGISDKGDGSYYASGLEPKPRNFTDSEFMKRVKDGYLIEVIGKGTAAFGKSPYCPPWGDTLKDDEKIRNIVAFLRTLYKKTTTENNE